MTRKNKYAKSAKLSERKFRELIKLFSVDLDASQIAKVTGLNRNTVNRYLKEIRKRIAQHCEEQSPFSGEVEVDESYFGARRFKGRRGRGTDGKTIVFGIFQRNSRLYTEIVPDCRRKTIQAVIRGRVVLIALSIPITGVATRASLTWVTKNIFRFNMPLISSLRANRISTESKALGVMQKLDSLSSGV